MKLTGIKNTWEWLTAAPNFDTIDSLIGKGIYIMNHYKRIEAILQEMAVEIMKPFDGQAENKWYGSADKWKVKVENPEYGNLGDCSYQERRIRIAKCVIDLNDQALLIDILRHECAHALAGLKKSKNGKRWDHHGPHWKAWAVRLKATPKAMMYPSDHASLEFL